MSTLKTTNLQHPSAVDPAIVLDADGNATVAGMGLVHINTTTFSAVSSVSLDDVFTSTYENYQIVVDSLASSNVSVNMRMRASGTDASGSSTYKRYLGYGSSAPALGTAFSSNGSTVFILTTEASDTGTNVQVYKPFEAVRTKITHLSAWDVPSGNTGIGFGSSIHTLANSYDGFTVFLDSGTFTGTIRVYGYRNEA